MPQSITLWDRTTPLNNGSSDSGINWLENQAPSSVNNSARAMMERLAEYYYDSGAVNTVAGTGDAVTVTVNDGIAAYITGFHFRFVASAANTGAATVNVNAIGVKAIRKISGGTDVALAANDLLAGETYLLMYRATANAAAGAFLIIGSSASVADASTTVKGIVELATNAETIAGTSSTLVPTVNNLYFPTGYLSGFLMTPAADAANDFSMAIGSARSSDDTTNIVLGSALIKQIDATWVVGTNQGGRFFTTLTAGSQIYAYVIKDPVNNLVDWGYSDNATNPTGGASYPAAYTKYARVGAFWRSSGSANLASRVFSVPSTNWEAYTPTFTSLGTPTGVAFFTRRNGPDLELQGTATTGNSIATQVQITYGAYGTNANILPDSAVIPSVSLVGDCSVNQLHAPSYTVLAFNLTNYFAIGLQQATTNVGLSGATGTVLFGNAWLFSLRLRIPVLGWNV